MSIVAATFGTFNLVTDDISRLEIAKNHQGDNCNVREKGSTSIFYKSFILTENSKSKTVCDIRFDKSSITEKFLPRIVFKKTDVNLIDIQIETIKPAAVYFQESEDALVFWKLIGFLNSFKDVVELGDFEKSFSVNTKQEYFAVFETLNQKQRVDEVLELIKNVGDDELKEIVSRRRKYTVKRFFQFLKNHQYKGELCFELYKKHFQLRGDEAVWHHFLKHNDWILGLNVDIKFVRDFYDESKLGAENSKGSGSPKVDMVGISDYTMLIELKHHNTKIFAQEKSNKSRANTWDFTADFIEGLSQCLGQKFALDKTYEGKDFLDNEKEMLLDKNLTYTVDPKSVFIVGTRQTEFPHGLNNASRIKSYTFERFRRNNRNIDIITYDELFERAYHIVNGSKLPIDWFTNPDFTI